MPASKPTIYLMVGCNGAGKTTFAKEFLPRVSVIRFLNADEIARGLSPLKPEAVAFKAGRLLLNELRELVDRHETFAAGKVVGRIRCSQYCSATDVFLLP